MILKIIRSFFKKHDTTILNIGDIIIFTSECQAASNIYKPISQILISENEEYLITNIREASDGDSMITLINTNDKNKTAVIPFFKSRKFWKTKFEMRDLKLKKIGI
jgi:hypothetical protein